MLFALPRRFVGAFVVVAGCITRVRVAVDGTRLLPGLVPTLPRYCSPLRLIRCRVAPLRCVSLFALFALLFLPVLIYCCCMLFVWLPGLLLRLCVVALFLPLLRVCLLLPLCRCLVLHDAGTFDAFVALRYDYALFATL